VSVVDFSWVDKYWPLFVQGLWCTVLLLVISATFGFLLAILVAVARISRFRMLRVISGSFTTVIRGTPLLVQIYIVYYGVGTLLAGTPGIRTSLLWPYLRDGFWYVALSLTISVAAYDGELLRGGLLSVPKGEIEAARGFGMSRWLILRRIWLPAAIRMLLPNLLSLVGAANRVRSDTFLVYEPLLAIAVVYLLFSGLLALLGARADARVARR
jgi:polar amino acid transport system permease protein